jgi:hypothetical protein
MTTLYQNAHSPERAAPSALQYLDVIFVVLGAIIALILGAPSLGVIVGAAGWLLQRALQMTDRRITARVDDSLRRAGVRLFEAFGRIFLLAAAIIIAGLAGGRQDGLAATLVVLGGYSVAFVVRLISGPPPPERKLN